MAGLLGWVWTFLTTEEADGFDEAIKHMDLDDLVQMAFDTERRAQAAAADHEAVLQEIEARFLPNQVVCVRGVGSVRVENRERIFIKHGERLALALGKFWDQYLEVKFKFRHLPALRQLERSEEYAGTFAECVEITPYRSVILEREAS